MTDPSVVLIHKVPAIWEAGAKSQSDNFIDTSSEYNLLENLSNEEAKILENLESDIFFLLAKSIANYLEVPKIDIILGHDSIEKRNWDVISRIGKIELNDNCTFWSMNSPNEFPEIKNIKVLIVRGNYPNLHNELMKKYSPSTTVFYPATSLFFPHFTDRIREIIPKALRGEVDSEEMNSLISDISAQAIFSRIDAPIMPAKLSDAELFNYRRLFRNFAESAIAIADKTRHKQSIGKYPIVLYDDQSNLNSLKMIYPKSRLLKFNKAASPLFDLDMKSERDIDIIFTGTTIQKTKNYDLFYNLVDKLLLEDENLKIVIVGVTEGISELNKKWSEHDVQIFDRVSKEELCDLFNRSKTHLITSGRDCFPRTIPESIACGCFVMALDILSDGLSVLRNNPLIGCVIDTHKERLILKPSYSVSVELLSNSLIEQIMEQVYISRNPLLISAIGSEIFPKSRMVQLDMIWQEVDLGLRELKI